MIWDKNKSDADNLRALEQAARNEPIFDGRVTFKEAAEGMLMFWRTLRLSALSQPVEHTRSECQFVPYDRL